MLEILEFTKETLLMVLFVSFKIKILCEKKEVKNNSLNTSIKKNKNIKKVDEDITLNKYLVRKEYEYKQQGFYKHEIEEKIAEDTEIWEKTHGSWHDSTQ